MERNEFRTEQTHTHTETQYGRHTNMTGDKHFHHARQRMGATIFFCYGTPQGPGYHSGGPRHHSEAAMEIAARTQP